MNASAPYTFDEPAAGAEAGVEIVPQVVVLAHAMVQPHHLARMPYGVGWETQTDDAVHRPAVSGYLDIGQPGGAVGRHLAPESVLRGGDDLGSVPTITQSAY